MESCNTPDYVPSSWKQTYPLGVVVGFSRVVFQGSDVVASMLVQQDTHAPKALN